MGGGERPPWRTAGGRPHESSGHRLFPDGQRRPDQHAGGGRKGGCLRALAARVSVRYGRHRSLPAFPRGHGDSRSPRGVHPGHGRGRCGLARCGVHAGQRRHPDDRHHTGRGLFDPHRHDHPVGHERRPRQERGYCRIAAYEHVPGIHHPQSPPRSGFSASTLRSRRPFTSWETSRRSASCAPSPIR